MEGTKPPRNRRRRDRAARMQKRQQQRHLAVADMSEAEESPPVRQKRPPARKKRIKEPIFQEDIVDGFAFLCFKSFEDLERTVNKYDKKAPEEGSTEDTRNPDHPPVLEESAPKLDKKPKTKKNNTLPKVKKKNNFVNHKSHNNLKDPCLTNDENSKPGEEILETPRGTSRDQLSDASSHASLERGYMCDSESGDERGSEPECDLFNSKTDSNFIAKQTNPGHSQTTTCRSPPLLPHHPVLANGTSGGSHPHHPEPAVAAVTAGASPAATATAAGGTEPQIGSPAVLRAAAPSPKLSNGYEFVSDTSPPSPAKLSSPSKYLHHKRAAAPPSNVPSAAAKPAAINVYDFVSDHSAPSSPDGVIFISQSKFNHHKGGQESSSKEPPAPMDTSSSSAAVAKVSNGHLCPSPPVLSAAAPPVVKSALDMTIKPCKAEPLPQPILPPTIEPHHLSPQPSSQQHQRSSSHHYSPRQQQQQPSSQYSPQPRQFSGYSSTSQQQQPRSKAGSPSRAAARASPAARDTHSAHSNSSSLSSLSQLSKEGGGGGGSRSHSNSSVVPLTSATYGAASSLTGLVFSKPQSWSGTCTTTNTLSVSSSRSTPPRGSPATLSGSLLPPAHHTSPFGSGLLPPAHLFPPSLASPLDAPGGPPASYRAPENLFSSHGEFKKHPDFLRRELDTRFLASQDHSIPIPPPPYMQSEVQHHSQMHQQASFIAPPPLGGPMVSQAASHLYEKYPKLDSSLYRRPSIGLSSYPPVSSLFTSSGGASTPFVPPAHLAALQPKINSVPKAKSMKPGKWCAMHVRIAWEIYNHQQKQKQAEAHKALVKPPPAEHLHPATNHLFCSLPRTHELSPFSTSLLSAASGHPRSYEASPHHSTFLNPTPAHLGPFSRPGYPNFAGAGPGFSGLGPLGMAGPSMLSAGDLRLPPSQEHPWVGQSRGLGPFGGGSAWGGLKEEAERDRLQQQERKREEERQKRAEQERREKEERERREQERREQERREQERRELERQEQERKEQERKEKERREMERRKEMERREMERREHERREQERQKERDREIRLHHQLHKSSLLMNGDHPHLRDPHHPHLHPHHPHHPHLQAWAADRGRSPHQHQQGVVKYEHPSPVPSPYGAVKIKQERKDEDASPAATPEKKPPLPPVSAAAALWDPYRGMARYEPQHHAKLLPPPPQLARAEAAGFFSPPYLGRGKPINGLAPPPLIPCSFPSFVNPAGRQEHKLMDPAAAYFAAAAAQAAKDRRDQVNGGAHEFDLRL